MMYRIRTNGIGIYRVERVHCWLCRLAGQWESVDTFTSLGLAKEFMQRRARIQPEKWRTVKGDPR